MTTPAGRRLPGGVLPGPKPSWLRRPPSRSSTAVDGLLSEHGLHTVCQEARCPNLAECFGKRTATFLILGDTCTRGCRYCAVTRGTPAPPDPGEPAKVARMVAELGVRHAVVTSVTRDDLPDGGAAHFVATIAAIRAAVPTVTVEVLIPDLRGAPLDLVLTARPDVFNHNVETVERLFPIVRPRADYRASLEVLAVAGRRGLLTKSGLMVGLGERVDEVDETLHALAQAGVQVATIGQYLPPSARHHPTERYVQPLEFERWVRIGRQAGLRHVFSGPLVRSSYMAADVLDQLRG